MREQVKININGNEVEVSSELTIRQASLLQGVEIPTFCYDDRLKPYTSCFICVVEVEGARGMIPACSTKVTPGMVIHTDSKKVVDTRKMALDLLLSDHAGDCIAPCEATCPANVDIQGYIAHVSNGDFEAATRLIKESNPLPVVCGRICPHPCESQCRRALVDEAVAINPLKRFSAEYELRMGPFMPETAADSNKKVSIVGGGPAGLSAAYFLRQMGHEVHLFEALPELGGMVRYGIPRFRLPWDKLDGEIRSIIDLGVKVHLNQKLGRDFTIESLKKEGSDAVLLAIGAHKASPMWVDNEDLPGVIGGIDFLRKAVLGEEIELGKRVVVIGGGDTAMDCSRVAKRLGADVTLLYRRSQAEMPALQHEQDETTGEGVEFRFLTAPLAVLEKDGRASGLKVTTMELGEPDASGRRRPIPVEGSEEEIPYDLIIAAIGQKPDLSCVEGELDQPEGTKWSTFVYDEKVMTTTVEGVFTAGDCAFGPDTVIRAIGEGKKAALAIDLFVSGVKVELKKEYVHTRGWLEDLDMADYSPRFVHKRRALETTHPAEVRMANSGYDPINIGIGEAQALAESSRCIECGCNAKFDCDLRLYSTEYNASASKLAGDCRKYEEDKRHPLIKFEGDKCITCGSCVRICDEFRGISALSFVQRGFSTKVAPNFEDPLQDTDCDTCGMCIDLCPTGAIAHNTSKEFGPWATEHVTTTCTSCSRGCALEVHSKYGIITKVTSVEGDIVNEASICKEGRFSHHLQSRLYPEPVHDLESKLEKAKNILSSSRDISVLISSNLTVETIFAAKSMVDSCGGQLYFAPGEMLEQSKFSKAKIEGQANIAFLERMGAKSWDSPESDCYVFIGIAAQSDLPSSKIIVFGDQDIGADVVLPMSDPLRMEGAFLIDRGDLALLKTNLPIANSESLYHLLSQLSGNLFESITDLRKLLVSEVIEFEGLQYDSLKRLIPTTLKPVLANVATDARGKGFEEFLVEKFQ